MQQIGASRLPLRLSLDRVWIYAACCALVASLPFVALNWFSKVAYVYDFACFWSAGATAGTRTLTDPQALYAWAQAHDIIAQPFSYPPGFAWFYTPLSHLSPISGLVVEEVVMIAAFVAGALVAARVYGFNAWFCIAAVLGWAPTANSIEVGQNTALAVALVFAVAWAMQQRRSAAAGLFAGLLLYKPTIALPILLMLLVRKEWRAAGVAAVCALGWYLASVAAAGGDWFWPAAYLHTMAWWLPMDLAAGSSKAFSLPTLLIAHGLSVAAASLIGAAILLATLPVAARASAVEAASMMPLAGLAASVHAWPYEAALALPAIFYTMARMREPWRTRSIATLYAAVAILLITRFGNLALAVLCIGGTALWLWNGYRMARTTPARQWPV
jgi:hypothetical protein